MGVEFSSQRMDQGVGYNRGSVASGGNDDLCQRQQDGSPATSSASFASPRPPSSDLLDGIELYGWEPDPSLSIDDNLMDLTLLVTRSSQLRQGSMGCLLVKAGYDDVNGDDCIGQNDCTGDGKVELQHQHQGKGKGTATTETNATTDIYKSLVSVATNQSLYKPNESDIHAEIVAISTAARYGRPTNGTTAFITMPPCKKCLGALISAGITKIVSRYRLNTSERIDACQLANIEYVDFGKERSDECEARVKNLIPPDPTIEEKRKIRRGKKHHKQEEADGDAGDKSCTIEAGAAVTSGRGSSTCNTTADITTNKIRNGSLTETTSPSQTEQSAYEGKRKRDEE